MKTTTTHPYRVLIADDQADIRDALRLLLKRESYETHAVASPADALSAIEAREFDAVLIDLKKHGALWEDLYDAYLVHARRREPRESLAQVKRLLQRRPVKRRTRA